MKIYEINTERKLKMRDILIYFDVKYCGNWVEIYNAISKKEKAEPNEIIKIANEELKKYDIITMIDDNYPDKYKSMYKPPFLIRKIKTNI